MTYEGPSLRPTNGTPQQLHQQAVCTELWKLRANDVLCDVRINVGNKTLKAHGVVLCACSTYLKSRCASRVEPLICMKDHSYETCLKVLEYLYTGRVWDNMETKDRHQFLEVCKLWQIELREIGSSCSPMDDSVDQTRKHMKTRKRMILLTNDCSDKKKSRSSSTENNVFPNVPANKISSVSVRKQNTKKTSKRGAMVKKCHIQTKEDIPPSIDSENEGLNTGIHNGTSIGLKDESSLSQNYKLAESINKKETIPAKQHLECKVCATKFRDRNLLLAHNVEQHWSEDQELPEMFQCEHPSCQYRTPNRWSLQSHRMNVHPHERSICDVCGKSLKNEACLKQHKSNIHSDSPRKFYPCTTCNKEFKALSNLQNHERTVHHELESERDTCICPYCAHTCLRSTSLSEHLYKKHDILPPNGKGYRCQHCDFKSINPAELKRHEARHQPESEQPFQCAHCKRGFPTKGQLTEHKKKHSDVKLFCCSYCNYSTKYQHNLRAHVQVRHQKAALKRWNCDVCSYCCNSKGNLYKHLRNVHKRTINTKWCHKKVQRQEGVALTQTSQPLRIEEIVKIPSAWDTKEEGDAGEMGLVKEQDRREVNIQSSVIREGNAIDPTSQSQSQGCPLIRPHANTPVNTEPDSLTLAQSFQMHSQSISPPLLPTEDVVQLSLTPNSDESHTKESQPDSSNQPCSSSMSGGLCAQTDPDIELNPLISKTFVSRVPGSQQGHYGHQTIAPITTRIGDIPSQNDAYKAEAFL